MTTTHMLSPVIRHKESSLNQNRIAMDNDDEHSDYIDMSPSLTPSHIHRISPARSWSATGVVPSPSQAEEKNRKSSSSEEADYTDMANICGTSIVIQNSSPTSKRKQKDLLKAKLSSTCSVDGRNKDVYASPKNKIESASSRSVDNLNDNLYLQPIFPSQQKETISCKEEPNSPSHRIKEGGFNKDDQDDYADVETIKSDPTDKKRTRSSIAQTPSRISKDDFKTQKSSSDQKLLPSTEKDFNGNFRSKGSNSLKWDEEEVPFRSRSGGMSCNSNFFHSSSVDENILGLKRSISVKTAAGKAAKKVLTQSSAEKDTKQMYEMKRTSSAGVVRSGNRYSSGVQSRINRNRQHQSMKHIKAPYFSEDIPLDLPSQTQISKFNSADRKNQQSGKNVAGSGKDRRKSSLIEEINSNEIHRKESFHKAFRKVSDGSQMLKYIADGRKTKSLDKDYLEWLVKTSCYVSRTPSVTSSITDSEENKYSSLDLKESSSSSLGKDSFIIEVGENADVDEAYENYKTAVSQHQKEKKESREKQKISFWHRSKTEKTKSADVSSQDDIFLDDSPGKKSRKSSKIKKKKKKENAEEIDKNFSPSPKRTLERNESFCNQKVFKDNEPNMSMNNCKTEALINCESEESVESDAICYRKDNSMKSSKRSRNIGSHSSLSRLVTVANANQSILSGSKTSTRPSKSGRSSKQNSKTLDLASGIKSAGSIPALSILDISLDSNYEDDLNGSKSLTKAKHHSLKSNTLGRLFGRKGKKRKSLDQVKRHSGSAEGLLNESKPESEKGALMQMLNISQQMASQALPNDVQETALFYMENVFLVHGFVFEKRCLDPNWEHYDGSFALFTGKKARTLGPLNKYATITGLSSLLRGSKDTRGNKNKDAVCSSNTLAVTEKSFGWSSTEEDDDDDCFYKHKKDSNNSSTNTEKVLPICSEKDHRIVEIAASLLYCIRSSQPDLLVSCEDMDEESDEETVNPGSNEELKQFLPDSFVKGNELITWLSEVFSAKHALDEKEDVHFKSPPVPSRRQISGMWQLLLEEGAIAHVRFDYHFEDCDLYYGFHQDVMDSCFLPDKIFELNEEIVASNADKRPESMEDLMPFWVEELDLNDVLIFLRNHFHDAMFRKALRKQPSQRTKPELKMIYEELLHFNSISHLSDSVKRELAKVLKFEVHTDSGKTLFRQGDEGTCWYILLRGSVEVEVAGKGIVCTLQEGDDFGSLALLNNAPRSATIILSDCDCHFIRVDKSDYFRILKDVEENTLRLKEHGKDVLILEKISTSNGDHHEKTNGSAPSDYITTPRRRAHSYSITAGTPVRILEHILEYLQPWKITFYDETLENFILMFSTFMKNEELFNVLLDRYRSERVGRNLSDRSMKRKIVYFVVRWSYIFTYLRNGDEVADRFLKDLEDEINFDSEINPQYSQLKDEFAHLYKIYESRNDFQEDSQEAVFVIEESVKRYQAGSNLAEFHRPLKSSDQALIKVYNSEQTYTTVKLPLRVSAEQVVNAVTEKLWNKTDTNLKLIEVFETGDRNILPKNQRSVATSINVNSLLCVSEKRDSFELKKGPRPLSGVTKCHFDEVSSLEIAYYVTQYDWHLLDNIHVLEYVYKVFGARKFRQITPNIDVFSRRFNQLAYWPPTEICACPSVNKRAVILRKFIKIAQHLKRYQNMNGFIAIMIGIGNQAVSRLSNTWEKLPAKYRKLVHEYETILDPSRNHHNYRVFASSMEPPYIPYFPLLIKDMTFQHEGNDDQKQELVNFEKMHMISTSIRTIIRGCSVKLEEEAIFTSTKTSEDTKQHVQSMQVITDQRFLNELSAQLEPKR